MELFSIYYWIIIEITSLKQFVYHNHHFFTFLVRHSKSSDHAAFPQLCLLDQFVARGWWPKTPCTSVYGSLPVFGQIQDQVAFLLKSNRAKEMYWAHFTGMFSASDLGALVRTRVCWLVFSTAQTKHTKEESTPGINANRLKHCLCESTFSPQPNETAVFSPAQMNCVTVRFNPRTKRCTCERNCRMWLSLPECEIFVTGLPWLQTVHAPAESDWYLHHVWPGCFVVFPHAAHSVAPSPSVESYSWKTHTHTRMAVY